MGDTHTKEREEEEGEGFGEILVYLLLLLLLLLSSMLKLFTSKCLSTGVNTAMKKCVINYIMK